MQNPVSWCANENDDPVNYHPYNTFKGNKFIAAHWLEWILPWHHSSYIAFIWQLVCRYIVFIMGIIHLRGSTIIRFPLCILPCTKLIQGKNSKESHSYVTRCIPPITLRGWKVTGWKTKRSTWRISALWHFRETIFSGLAVDTYKSTNWRKLAWPQSAFQQTLHIMSMHNKYISWLH